MLSSFSSSAIFATLTFILKVSSIAVPASPVLDAVAAATTSALMSGDGTWYGDDCGEEACWQGGACAFVDYTLPTSIAGSTCVSELIWDDSYPCGGCVSITYDNTTKIAMITNKTGGDAVHLDMTPDMFSQLADKSLGEIDIEWEYVACPITDPLEIRMHTGASQYWFAATVLNAVYRTSKLEVSSDGGSTYTAATRNTNGYYEVSGGTGTTTAWVRVTSETGTQVVVENVSMTASTVTTATANYA